MKRCRHIDHNPENYPSCKLVVDPMMLDIKYFERVSTYEGCPTKVQFCGKSYRRINSVLDCYESPGPSGCYESSV